MEAVVDPQAPSPPPPLGQLLATERERQGLSRADVAQRLHMSAWQIEALEGGEYERLPKGTFLRGFVRNYTKLLGLNSEAALDALSSAAPKGPAPGIVVPSQNIRFDPMGERLRSPYVKAWGVAGVAFALLSAGMYWWWEVRPDPPATHTARKEAPPAPAPQNIAAAPMPPADPPAPVREAPQVEEPRTEPPRAAPLQEMAKPAAARVAVPEPARPPGTRTVTLRFKGSSWVEIKDRSGRVLLSKLNEPGSEAEVSGRPPFSVVVGNAPDVTLLYDDREFPLEPHTKVAVARFTLE